MAMTLRLSPSDEETLSRLARAFGTSKNMAAAAAIDLAAQKPDHAEFVRASTQRLLERYAALLSRLVEA